jgi:hypothetical protein
VDEQRLARLEPGAVEDVRPDGEERLRQARRLDVAQLGRARQALADRRDAELGIAAAGDERADARADREAGGRERVAITVDDRSRDFEAGMSEAPGGTG